MSTCNTRSSTDFEAAAEDKKKHRVAAPIHSWRKQQVGLRFSHDLLDLSLELSAVNISTPKPSLYFQSFKRFAHGNMKWRGENQGQLKKANLEMERASM